MVTGSTIRPPSRCPCCGERIRTISKHYDRVGAILGRSIRVPVAVTAEYFCGARIESRYHIRSAVVGVTSHLNGAHWRLTALVGCVNSAQHILDDYIDHMAIEPARDAA